jgi:hypothetical protein
MGRRLLAVLVVLALWPAAASAKPIALSQGTAKISFDVNFGLKLIKFGVTPGAIAPATQDGLVITAPIQSGSHARPSGTGATIKTSGGLSQVADGLDLQLRLLQFVVHGRHVRLSSRTIVNGLDTDRFVFAKGVAGKARRTAGGYTVQDLKLGLNDIGAATLNSQLGTTEFAVGETLGTVVITARR